MDLRKTPVGKNIAEVLCQNKEQGNALPDCAMVNQLCASSSLSTPKRRIHKTGEVKLTSTPVESSSPDVFSNIAETLTGADRVALEYNESVTQSKVTFSVLSFFCLFSFAFLLAQSIPKTPCNSFKICYVAAIRFGLIFQQISIPRET